jgi:PAT family beta-lactamase induction signal transducer AmpG
VSLAERRWLRLFTLCALYVAQGIPWGFMATTLPAYIKSRGVADTAVASAMAMTTLPYAFKWVWGPLMDVFTIPSLGRRRPWIMFAQLMMAVTVLVMLLIPDISVNLEMLAWMILIHTVFNSMQDVAVDALAVDLLDEDERGRANGLMYGSKYGGAFIGGAGMSRVIDAYSLEAALVMQTAILLAIMMLPLFLKERSGPPPPREPAREVLGGLVQIASVKSTLLIAIFMLGINLPLAVLAVVAVGLYTGPLGWTPVEYTDLVGGLALVAGLVGAALGGFLADLVGRKRLIVISSVALAGGWLVFGFGTSLWRIDAFVYVIAIWQILAYGILSVGTFALCMDASWPRVAATQFTAFMALANLSSTIGYKIGGKALEWFDYDQLYLVAACVQLVFLLPMLLVDAGEARRKLPFPAGTPISALSIVTGLLFVVAVGVVPVWLIL